MKKYIISAVFAILFVTNSFADNVLPQKMAHVSLSQNSLEVRLDGNSAQAYQIKLYDNQFRLVFNQAALGTQKQQIDMSQLGDGHYILHVEIAGESLYTEVIRKQSAR